jgi:xanthine dehydrogenase accessory factor
MLQRALYQEIENELRAGRPVVQATVIQTKGSTPRKAGSEMLIKSDGKLFGTIGGGCGEAGVIQKARLSLADGRMREELADLTEDISTESEAVCGGTFRVFLEPWQPRPEHLSLVERLKELAGGGEEVLVHRIVKAEGSPAHLGLRVLQRTDGSPIWPDVSPVAPLPAPPERKPHQLKQVGDYQIYTERWTPVPTLVIVGAGHIAEPLEEIGRLTGFETVVIDDRHLFANRERFPEAGQVICGPILDVVRQIPLTPYTFLVLVTRGHVLDMDALRVVVERNERVAYIGMIGSARRVRAVFELLEKEGLPRKLFENVRSPIGLNIGAETPAEIAVCIAAEMISVLRGSGTDTRPMFQVSGIHPSLRASATA